MTTATIFLLACLPVALAHGPTPHHDETARTPAVAGWWKGNTHTHTWWSDGDSPPESVSSWYRERGYNFLVLSDHNRMQEGEFWYPVNNDAKKTALKSYIEKFGADWVERRERDGVTEVKLKTLDEFRSFFEARNEFIFIRGMEITDRFDNGLHAAVTHAEALARHPADVGLAVRCAVESHVADDHVFLRGEVRLRRRLDDDFAAA
jgi:hypothetical protein